MINILFFIESLSGGGAEKVLCNLVNAMDQTQFAITVQTLYPEDAGKYLAQGIRYRYCYPKASRWNDRRMRIEAALGLTYPLHIRDAYDIEVAYLECGATKIMAGSTNKQALKLAWVHSDLKSWGGDVSAFAAKTRKYYEKYDAAVCVSENVRRSFEELFGSAVRAVTVYNTINDADIVEKAARPLPEGIAKHRFTVVTVGRLSAPKHFTRALMAHKRLLEEGISHDLWIVGEGEERSVLEEYIRDNHLEASAKLLGFHENPYNLMKCADLLICSSIYEGFSTFVAEGLILGKPIVTTDVSGMRELLGDSEYGLITENDDEAFYQGMKRMLTDPQLLTHYREQAELRGKDFSCEKLVRATETFLEQEYLKKLESRHGH